MGTRNELSVVLVLTASDPDGEQGVQSELKAVSGYGHKVYVSTIITARIFRSPGGIRVAPVSPEVVRSQLSAAMEAIKPDVVKVGFLPGAACVCEAVAVLRRYGAAKVIYSPLLCEAAGRSLYSADTLRAIACHLLPVVRLLVVRREDSVRLLEVHSAGIPYKKLDDVNLARCLISTFHCACYLLRPAKNNILALREELFYYRPLRENPAPQQEKNLPRQTAITPAPETGKSRQSFQPAIHQSFTTAVACAWTACDDIKRPLHEARVFMDEIIGRTLYLNEDFKSAPHYPLTEGGNYE